MDRASLVQAQGVHEVYTMLSQIIAKSLALHSIFVLAEDPE